MAWATARRDLRRDDYLRANGIEVVRLRATYVLDDPDQAAINVNNRVQRATSTLPQEVTRQGVVVAKRSNSILAFVAMFSNNTQYDRAYVGNYALLNVIDDLKRLPGIGDVNVLGDIDYSMRVLES